MNANTAMKINDAIAQAIRCGESVEATYAQVRKAMERAVEERNRQHEQAVIRGRGGNYRQPQWDDKLWGPDAQG